MDTTKTGDIKDGYRWFYQNGYIWDNISKNDTRQFGTALKVADKLLTQYGTHDTKRHLL